MVAYTDPDCIPYWEGGDGPCVNTGTLCEPSTVMCDAMSIVEARLDEFDDLVARIATSTPIALVTRETSLRTVVGDSVLVEFTSSVVDTDNMVSLDAEPTAIQINQSGLYQVFFSFRGLASIATAPNTVQVSATLQVSTAAPYPNLFTNAIIAGGTAHQNGAFLTVNASSVWPLTAGQVLTLDTIGNGTVNDGANWSAIAMGAAWMGELP